MAAANVGHVPSYGADPYTRDAVARISDELGGDAQDRALAEEGEGCGEIDVAPLAGGDAFGDAAEEGEGAEGDDQGRDAAARDEGSVEQTGEGGDDEGDRGGEEWR